MIVMMPWVLRTWRGLRGRPRIETRGLTMLDRLHDQERAALAETRRLRSGHLLGDQLRGDTPERGERPCR